VAERKKRIGEESCVRLMALLTEFPIIVEQEPPERMVKEIFALARKQELSGCNASYLDLAMRKGLLIATFNEHLIAAAKRSNASILKGK